MVGIGATEGDVPGLLDLDCKCAALAKLAFAAKIAAHCGYEPFGYGKAKTGATMVSANGIGGSGERLEDKLQFVRWNADARITYGKHQAEVILACGAGGF